MLEYFLQTQLFCVHCLVSFYHARCDSGVNGKVLRGDIEINDRDQESLNCAQTNGSQDLRSYLTQIPECNPALEEFCRDLKERIESSGSTAPSLAGDALTPHSVRLRWEGKKMFNVTYTVQWKYEEMDATWQFCKNQSWVHENDILIHGLQPYTRYQFRVMLVLEQCNGAPYSVGSAPSLVIGTMAAGVPSSPPIIVSAIANDATNISVSWQPGLFPNAPLLSYALEINQLPAGYTAVKDIPAGQNNTYCTFENLTPSRNYSVSIAMRNMFGKGPSATIIVCTPAASSDAGGSDVPTLILASYHTVEKSLHGAKDMFENLEVLFRTENIIKGVGIHVHRELLFVSDSSGKIFMSSSSHSADPVEIFSQGSARPLDLSVDWLNDHLYILQNLSLNSSSSSYQIIQSSLDGSNQTVVVSGLSIKPDHIEIDPYNGYLFWAVKGIGVFRLDLADIGMNPSETFEPTKIYENPNLGVFIVDYTNFQLIAPVHNDNTVISISFDGKGVSDLRKNTQRPQFQDVKSLAMANDLFYWTNGENILTEEYHPGLKSFFHNGFQEFLKNFPLVAIMVNLPSSQPVPVPVNAPECVQAIMSSTFAKVSWQPPRRLSNQGRGAWQGWSYKLCVKHKNNILKIWNVNVSKHIITSLLPGTEYSIKVAAVTSSGQGPWSEEFKGQTMTRSASILWSTTHGLLSSDVTGDNVTTLITKDSLKEGYENYRVNDIAWIKDKLFLVSNTSHIHWFNVTDKTSGKLKGIDSVGSISIDWIANRLYWSNPKQQMLTRGNLDGSEPEILPVLTVAKELNVDSVGGYLYWSTGHAVEIAHLNGRKKRSLYPSEPFSGRRVIGLTLDMEDRSVYWIVRSYEGSSLFKAFMADPSLNDQISPIHVITLESSNLQDGLLVLFIKVLMGEIFVQLGEQSDFDFSSENAGPLRYLDGHLLWLQDSNTTVIGDKACKNTAVISEGALSNLNTVHVFDPNVHTIPAGFTLDSIKVVPDSVDNTSIRVDGTFKLFNITWNPVVNINFGELFYEIKIKDQDKDFESELTSPCLAYEGVRPYTPLKISIRAFTYWASSNPTHAVVHSPPSAPSLPLNARIFVEHVHSPLQMTKNVKTTFRWSVPAFPNGEITSYRLFYYYALNQSDCKMNHEVSMDVLEYSTFEIPFNATVHFQVSACNKGGCSDFTLDVSTNTSQLTPLPKLLFFSSEALMCLDFDNHTSITHFSTPSPAIDFAANFFENQVFWIDNNKIMWSAPLNAAQKIKLTILNGTGQALAVDWVGRIIFWSESDTKMSHVYALNLNNGAVSSLFSRQSSIICLQVAPLQSLILWIEENEDKTNSLMSSKFNGSDIQPLFDSQKSRKRRNSCDCPTDSIMSQVLSIEYNENLEARVLWYDEKHKKIWSTDVSGCPCVTLITSVKNEPNDLPLTSLTSDSKYIYWSSYNRQIIYSAMKNETDGLLVSDSPLFSSFSSVEISKILAVGSHLQPYPDAKCLVPMKHSVAVSMLNKTDHSITLKIPTLDKDDSCRFISTPIYRYAVYYGSVSNNSTSRCAIDLSDCWKIMTYEHVIKIEDLKAYEQYVFRVAVQNYFSDLGLSDLSLGPLIVLRTAVGAPAPPQNLSAVPLSPNRILVEWNHSSRFKLIKPAFLLSWTAEEENGVRHNGEITVVSDFNYPHNRISTTVSKLHPNLHYQIKVRTFYEDDGRTYSETAMVGVSTYPEPHDLVLNSATSRSLNISWLGEKEYPYSKYVLEFCESAVNVWNPVVKQGKQPFYILGGLSPKVRYSFRLAITFSKFVPVFIWPLDSRFSFLTLGDKPSPPGAPFIQSLFGAVYKITWESSKENGGTIELYRLEGKKKDLSALPISNSLTADNSSEFVSNNWTLYYNGTENYWIVTELSPNCQYQFRVCSKNMYGWSNFSEISDSYDLDANHQLIIHDTKSGLPFWIFIPLLFIFILVLICVLHRFFRRTGKKKNNIFVNGNGVSCRRGSDAELATLRELPRHPNFIENTNILYATSDNCFFDDEEQLKSLPHIRRDQITLTKFLGSGAFGEVFEGVAKDTFFNGPTDETRNCLETRVAIKTLRKRASGHEKTEFIKEALLMSNFKHPHILPLLGVCLDNDPAFIISELMEGGDLLCYLRQKRPLTTTEVGLTLDDLITMSLDVVKGCCYLEEMHFVHRDLACRNCLVSSHDPLQRIVKIGDFGLARDIYKNDYYRKEGEGLLPVRWMAPESLVDGVFTSQSDVWSFGVLVWEVLTLGQRPYPARSNLEVLNFVRNGGRLSKPCNATEQLYELMQRCWSFSPSDRPSFRFCRETLESIKETCSNTPLVIEVNDYISLEKEDEPNQQTDSRISNSSGDVSASLPALTDSQGYLKLNEETNNAESDSSQHTGACEQSQSSASMPKETIGPAFENNNFPIINRNQTYDVS
ncbi:proto-oncogene tyrosine-protein kinase ROS isoform X1 [Bemisia tabaci]|uniref:proto-oncogene tyrosine-protein kinase ROS isoform X1 n=3 Tax=Bemisia tabaci TaxID=7038 RepID=UPI003B28B909